MSKYIEVQTLIRGKYQHNLEFAQFLKSVWEANINEEHLSSYDAVARRRLGKGAESMPIYNPGGVLRSAAAAPKPRSRVDPASANVSASKHPPGARTGRAAAAATSATPAGRAAAAVERLRRENAELKVSVESLEREREFYFSKLRDVRSWCWFRGCREVQTDMHLLGNQGLLRLCPALTRAQIEILLQTVPSSDQKLTDAVFKIMYATEDDFEVPEGAPATGCSPELPGEEPSAEEPTVSATPLSDATGNTHEADGKETVLPSAPIGEENVIPGEA